MTDIKKLLDEAFDWSPTKGDFCRDVYDDNGAYVSTVYAINENRITPLAKDIILELVEAIKKHHKVWGHNDCCFTECNDLCQTLESVEAKLRGIK